MKELLSQKEINGYRISIYPDYDAQCPCTEWDMVWRFLWEYDRCHKLSSECNEDDFSADSLQGALIELITKNIAQKKIVKYIKDGKLSDTRLSYSKSDKVWYLEFYDTYRNRGWYKHSEFKPNELKNCDIYEILEWFENEQLIQMIDDLCDEILVKEFSSSGYCQGDHFSGVAFVTKDWFEKRVSKDTKDWKQKALDFFDGEKKCIEMWALGDVKGFVLEKRVDFTKLYKDGTTDEDFEWKQIDSCCGYYMEDEELIEEVISEHHLNEKVA